MEDLIQLGIGMVAFYAAIISTLSFFTDRNYKRYLKKKGERQLTVEISVGIHSQHDDPVILITMANPGDRTVTVQTPTILLPNKSALFFPDPLSNVTFPHDLQDGKNCVLWTSAYEVIKQLRNLGFRGETRLVAQCTDGVGKKYTGNSILIDAG